MKDSISILRDEIGLLYQNTKEFLKERTEEVRSFKNVFNDVIGDLWEKKLLGVILSACISVREPVNVIEE